MFLPYCFYTMNKISLMAIASCIAICTMPMGGKTYLQIARDSALSDHKLIYFGKGENPERDSTNNLLRQFYEDQFRHFQDPMAPYFLFLSRDNNLAMGVGGMVRMRAYYDWGGAIPSPGFAPYLIPMTPDPTRKQYFGTTPAGTALFFRVLGMNKKLGQYQLYIEANFNGYQARDFHLKKAYGVINDWTFGYTNSTFSDPAALPPTVDASGPNAKIDATAVLVRWAHKFKHRLSMAVSIESPSNAIDTQDSLTKAVAQYAPDLAAFGQYDFPSGGHIRLAGILRTHAYRNLLTEKNHRSLGWGLQLSGSYSPLYCLSIMGMINGGKGYQSLGGDWLMGKYDMVPMPDQPGKMYMPGAIGGYAAVQWNINPSMFISGTFGGTRYLPKHHGLPNEYKSGIYMAFNYFWYLTPRISCAAEFNLGRRENMDGQTRWARRVGALVAFSF